MLTIATDCVKLIGIWFKRITTFNNINIHCNTMPNNFMCNGANNIDNVLHKIITGITEVLIALQIMVLMFVVIVYKVCNCTCTINTMC
jgi:hypothetical protein